VAVGSQSLDARVVAGYSLAATQLAADVSRYVNDQQAQNALRPVLGANAADVTSVAASPIPSSSIVRIEVLGTSAAAARQGSQAVAQQLVDQVNGLSSGSGAGDLLAQYTDISNQVSAAQQTLEDAKAGLASAIGAKRPQAEIDALRTASVQAQSAVDVLTVQQTALGQRYRNAVTSTPAASGLTIVQTGRVASDDRTSRAERDGLGGAVVGFLLALALAVRADRRRVRGTTAPSAASPSAGSSAGGHHAADRAIDVSTSAQESSRR